MMSQSNVQMSIDKVFSSNTSPNLGIVLQVPVHTYVYEYTYMDIRT